MKFLEVALLCEYMAHDKGIYNVGIDSVTKEKKQLALVENQYKNAWLGM